MSLLIPRRTQYMETNNTNELVKIPTETGLGLMFDFSLHIITMKIMLSSK